MKKKHHSESRDNFETAFDREMNFFETDAFNSNALEYGSDSFFMDENDSLMTDEQRTYQKTYNSQDIHIFGAEPNEVSNVNNDNVLENLEDSNASMNCSPGHDGNEGNKVVLIILH